MPDEEDITSLIIDSATRILRSRCDPQTLNNAAEERWKTPLWSDLEESGLTLAWIREDMGGAGAGLMAGFDILHVSGQFAVPVPLAETMLAGWLLAAAGLPAPGGALCVGAGDARDVVSLSGDNSLSGTISAVPFAGEAGHVALLAQGSEGPVVALIPAENCCIAPGASIAGDAQGDVILEGVSPAASAPAPAWLDRDALLLMGAAVRARQIAGALQAVLDLAVTYAQERNAFGRPIDKFQAVQHLLARLAGEAAAADAASGSAADAIAQAATFDDGVFLEVAAAKIRSGEAAGDGAAIAHQVFGAIGFTREHILQRYTRRLWAWRDDFGSESEWAEKLGRHVASQGADALWPMLAAR